MRWEFGGEMGVWEVGWRTRDVTGKKEVFTINLRGDMNESVGKWFRFVWDF